MQKPFNIAAELLSQHLQIRREKTAYIYKDEKITFGNVEEESNIYASLLRASGVQAGETVAVALPDIPETIYAFLGIVKTGAVAVMLNPQLSEENFEFILHDAAAVLLLTVHDSPSASLQSQFLKHTFIVDSADFHALAARYSSDADIRYGSEDDIAFMLYTSGSTGKPKGVPHRHRDIIVVAETYGRHILNITENDLILSGSKLFFAYGFGNSLIFPLRFGCAAILHPDKSLPSDLLQMIDHCRPSLFFSVPSLYNLMIKSMDAEQNFSSLRLCISAGEALPGSIFTHWKERTGVLILDGLGSTEALHIVVSNSADACRPGSSGRAVPGYEIRLVDESGNPSAAGTEGYLLVRGRSITPHYHNQPEKTAEVMFADGWLKTGDIYREEDGWYSYQGRGDDMFKVDARWVSPVQAESALREHPAVLECGVTWRKLESLVKPIAYIVLNSGFRESPALERDIITFARNSLPDYAVPVQVNCVAALPKTETGKIQRYKLRTQENRS